MKKVTLIAAAVAAFFTLCQPNSAQAGDLSFGQYKTFENQGGSATADLRNVNTLLGLGRTQVINLQATNTAQAQAYLHTANGSKFVNVPVVAPFQFSVPSGNPEYLQVIIIFTPPGGTVTSRIWCSPITKIRGNNRTLVQLLNAYAVPMGPNDLPSGSVLNAAWFQQSGDLNACDVHTCGINAIYVNGSTSIGLDATAGATSNSPCQ